jgi:hypothetical protein
MIVENTRPNNNTLGYLGNPVKMLVCKEGNVRWQRKDEEGTETINKPNLKLLRILIHLQ